MDHVAPRESALPFRFRPPRNSTISRASCPHISSGPLQRRSTLCRTGPSGGSRPVRAQCPTRSRHLRSRKIHGTPIPLLEHARCLVLHAQSRHPASLRGLIQRPENKLRAERRAFFKLPPSAFSTSGESCDRRGTRYPPTQSAHFRGSRGVHRAPQNKKGGKGGRGRETGRVPRQKSSNTSHEHVRNIDMAVTEETRGQPSERQVELRRKPVGARWSGGRKPGH